MKTERVKRRRSLVVSHLEGISRDALEKYHDIVSDYVKGHEGIYALFRKSRLYYVGLASNLRTRVKQHLKDKHAESWDRFSVYLTRGESHLKEMESLLIRVSKPPGNKQKAKFVRSEDLKRRFKRDVQRYQKQELDTLIDTVAKTLHKKAKVAGDSLTDIYAAGVRSIHGVYKGNVFKARITKTGDVVCRGKSFKSLSGAAVAIAEHAMDGWHFWKYRTSDGRWVRIMELRHKL
jgi:ElaB/YqjD/DUF883 family membrane-anchored ribosome-binding protein